jgi:hypothetical protein
MELNRTPCRTSRQRRKGQEVNSWQGDSATICDEKRTRFGHKQIRDRHNNNNNNKIDPHVVDKKNGGFLLSKESFRVAV